MKRLPSPAQWGSVCAMLSLLCAAPSAWADAVCEVLAVQGDAKLMSSQGAQSLAAGQTLEPGAELRTGPGGRVKLRFVDGSTLVLADQSQLRIDRFEAKAGKPREASLLLDLGLIGQKVQPSAGGSWRVRTPTAVTAVRGTEFMVEVGSDQATAVHVQTGAVAVESLAEAAAGEFASKSAEGGMKTRSLRKPQAPVLLQSGRDGTQCQAQTGCSAATAWSPARVQALQDRLGGF